MYKTRVVVLYHTAWLILLISRWGNIRERSVMITMRSGYKSYPIVLIIGRRITYVNYSAFSYKLSLRTIFRHHNMEDFLIGNLHTFGSESAYISY